MSKDSKHQDPRTWVKLSDGKPLLKAIPKRNLGKLLKRRRIKVTEFAKALGLKSDTSVHGWIKGTRNMSNEHLVSAALLLDVSPLYLMDCTWASEKHELTSFIPRACVRSDNGQSYYVRDDLIDWLRNDWIAEADLEHYEPEHEKSAERLEYILNDLYHSHDDEVLDAYERYDRLLDSLRRFPEDLRDPAQLAAVAFGIYLQESPTVTIEQTLTEVCRQVGLRYTRLPYDYMKKS